MIVVELTEDEKNQVRAEGRRRQSVNEGLALRGRNGAANVGDRALRYSLYGAAGEMAVAVFLGLKAELYKDQYAVKGSSDLPGEIDVKTRTRHKYDLIVQFDDNPNKNYWLVTIENKQIRLHGWLPHSECAKDEYKKDPVGGRAAYFVPKHKLYQPDTWNCRR